VDNQEQSEQASQSSLLAEAEESADSTSRPEGGLSDDELRDLLGGTPEPESGHSDSEPEGERKPPKRASLNTLAEAAGGPEALYNLTVSLPDSQGNATIEELKADATAYRKGNSLADQLQTDRTEFSNEKLRYVQQLKTAVSSLGPEALTDAKLAPVREFFNQQQQQEDSLLAMSVPDWDKRMPDIAEFMTSEYGAPEGALEQPAPAWVKKALYDWHAFNKRLKKVSEKRKPPAPAVKTARSPDTARTDQISSAIARAKRGGDPIDAIALLLQES